MKKCFLCNSNHNLSNFLNCNKIIDNMISNYLNINVKLYEEEFIELYKDNYKEVYNKYIETIGI